MNIFILFLKIIMFFKKNSFGIKTILLKPFYMPSNKIVKINNSYHIYLNISKNCIYDVKDIIINYDLNYKTVSIINGDIPKNIKDNMMSFYKSDVKKFVQFLEKNLEVFLQGRMPIINNEESILELKEENNKICKLPSNYEFPTRLLTTNLLEIDISKKNILLFSTDRPNIQVHCNYCQNINSISENSMCKCKNLLKMTFLPTVSMDALGSLFLEKCTFLKINPSKFQFNCENCLSCYSSYFIDVNQKFNMVCWSCNMVISFCIKKITYKIKKMQKFQIGTALPNKGTCKHYKKSYRWFRFPCCNSAYPCDICHNLETGHEAKFANKMICGLCSREQSNKNECECGMNLKKNTRFWEGGKGTRNKTTMSKKDSKKYTK